MPSRIKNFLRSFSFRVGAIFFIALCTTLVGLRMQTYYRSLYMSYADIRALINAHASDIDRGIERFGPRYAKYLVRAILQDTPDKRFYLAFKDGAALTGNLPVWPVELDPRATWQEIFIDQGDGMPKLHLLVKLTVYHYGGLRGRRGDGRNIAPLKKQHRQSQPHALLLTGYNLQRTDLLRNALLRVAISNVLLSLFMSFIISILVVWLINHYLQGINRAAGRVMGGQLQTRVPVSGAKDQFDKLSANINAMLDWIVTLLGTVRDSTNAIAHDMRTPLSRHRLELRALAEDPSLPQETRKKISSAVARVDDIVEMFDDILSIARAESRSGAELFMPFDVAETVRDVIEFYAALLEEKELTIAADLPAWPVKMTGDKQLVTQAVVNLLDNAIKYTPEGGHIDVSLKEAEDRIAITLADNGPGIPAPFLDKAKERFFRVDESRNTPGTGLGLSLVNAVAGLHRGTLILKDNAPGLCVTLTLANAVEES